jgi:hypothetical protein
MLADSELMANINFGFVTGIHPSLNVKYVRWKNIFFRLR